MMRSYSIVCSLFVAGLLSFNAFAEEPFKVRVIEEAPPFFTINLQKVVELVENQSLDVALAKNKVEQFKGKYMGSYAPLLPSVEATHLLERYEGGAIFIREQPVSVNRTTHRPQLSFDYDIQTGGKPIFQIKVAKSQLKQEKSRQDYAMQTALLKALSDYFVWLRNMSNVEVAHQSLNEANSQLQLNEARARAGFGTQLDVQQAKTVEAERQNLVLKAENEREVSGIGLASVLNLPLTLRLAAENPTIAPLALWEGEESLTQLFERAAQNRPDVKALTEEIKEAKAAYRAAFADLFPTINLGTYVGGVGPQLGNLRNIQQKGIYFNFDLLKHMGVGKLAEMKVTHTKIQEAILQKEKQLNEVQRTLAEAYSGWMLYKQQLQVTQQKINAAQEAYRIALARLKTGVGINLEAMKAQTDLTEARLDYQTTAMNYNLAQLKLLYELGELSSEKVLAAAENDFAVAPTALKTAQ